MKVLFIGDIVGSPGRQIVRERLADLVEQRRSTWSSPTAKIPHPALASLRVSPKNCCSTDIAVITGGNHSWDRKEIMDFMPHEPRLLRPANFPDDNPGTGLYVGTAKNGVKFAVLNLQGRVFPPADR